MSERERKFVIDLSQLPKPLPPGYGEAVERGLLSFDGTAFWGALRDFYVVKELVESRPALGVEATITIRQWKPPEQEEE